jgi:hypothetical protein
MASFALPFIARPQIDIEAAYWSGVAFAAFGAWLAGVLVGVLARPLLRRIRPAPFLRRGADVLVSVAVILAANWMILVLAAVADGSKERMCFRACHAARHVDEWTLAIFLPLLVIAATIVATVIGARRSPWQIWKHGRNAAVSSLLVVVVVLSVHVEALSSVPPWHWLDSFRIPSVS